MKMKTLLNNMVIVFLAVCSTIALFADVETTGNLSMALNGAGIAQLVTFFLLLYGYGKLRTGKLWELGKITAREKVIYGIVAVLFTLCMLIGKAQEAHVDLKFPILAVVLGIGYIPSFYGLVMVLGKLLDAKRTQHTMSKPGKVSEWLFEKHPVMGPMLCVYAARLPYWIAFFPCSMTWDGGIQISNFYGLENFTNHHPPLMSFFYGSIAWYSNQWGVANAGMFLITLIQTTMTAFAVAQTFRLFKRMQTPYWMRWGILAYDALFTVWCIFDCTVIKDSFYHPFTLLFTLKVAECILDREAFFQKKGNLVLFVVYAVLMTQVRNNGVYVLLLTIPFLLLLMRGKKLLVLAGMTVISFTAVFLLNQVVYPAAGVVNLEEKVDTYCIMYQQTAKYAQKHQDDVTKQEREVLDTLFDYDELAVVYNPRLADWVKNCLRVQEGSAEDPTGSTFAGLKDDYFKVWFAQLCRHPLTYAEAFLECSYGYYYPEERTYKEGLGFYEEERYTFTSSMSDAHQIEQMAPVRFLLEQISKFEYMPGIGMLYRCGFYTWMMIFLCAYLILQKRYQTLIITIPAWVNILVCLISPVNTCIRYMLPTMCFVPVLVALVFCERMKKS